MSQVNQSDVVRTWKRYRDTGTIDDMRRSGRPKVIIAVDDRYLRISARRNPESNATMLNNAFRAATGRRVPTQTVRNRLHDVQLQFRRSWQCPHLTPITVQRGADGPNNTQNGLVRICMKFYSQMSVAYAFNHTIVGDVLGDSLVRLNVLDILPSEYSKVVVP